MSAQELRCGLLFLGFIFLLLFGFHAAAVYFGA